MVNIYIETYGCTANQDNSAILKGLLINKGHIITNKLEKADIIIINTCIVKNVTESKIIYKIKKIIENYPNKKIIIAGCMPEAESKLCKNLFPTASLINTYHITEINKIIKEILKNKRVELLGKRKEIKTNLPKFDNKETTSIQISEGCLGDCFFCITKLAKGNLVSAKPEEIIKEIKNKLKKGYKRINLTATDCGCYGYDIGTNLVELLEEVVKIDGNFKVRVGMMNPQYAKDFVDELIRVYKNVKIMKFLHIPVESGSDKVLKDMNRKYSVKDFINIVNKFRKEIPGITISTDVIVGYPTETDKDFDLTLKLIEKIKPEVLNISKFGPRPGTLASKLKQLDSKIIKKRSLELNKIKRN